MHLSANRLDRWGGWAALAMLVSACNGNVVFPVAPVQVATGPTDEKPISFSEVCADRPPAPTVHSTLRKLGNAELIYSLQDLLGVSSVAADLPPDVASTEGYANNGDFLTFSPEYAEKALQAIEGAVAAAAAADTAAFKCVSGTQDSACARDLISKLMRRAYRTTVASSDLSSHVALFDSQRAAGDSFDDALGTVYARTLLSPRFLFRTATGGEAVQGDVVRLAPSELATRLAYFLWSSAPDEQLLNAADANLFANDTALRAEITRMLADPRAARFVNTFIGQWLGIDRLTSTVSVSRIGLDDTMRAEFIAETRALASHVFRDNQSMMDLLGADYSFINERLANHYGIAGVTGADLTKVSLEGTDRRGLITQASFLTLNAKPDDSAPVGRGNKILKLITCTPPRTPDFSADVAKLFAQSADPNATMRERMAVHRAKPECAGCHTEMDPIGLGLENYDQLGRVREKYANGREIVLGGSLRGVDFKNSAELVAIIKEQDDYKRCITRNLVVYAIGRAVTLADECSFQALGVETVKQDKTFVDFVVATVKSDLFQLNTFNE